MKKVLIIALLLITSSYVKAQNSYIITEKDVKIDIKGDINMDAISVSFYNGKKYKAYATVDLKEMLFNGRLWLRLPSKKEGGGLRLMEIVCYNDEYILTRFILNQQASYMYVFTWDKKPVQPRTPLFGNREKQKKNIDEQIKPLFKDCTELLNLMDKNSKDPEKTFIDDISLIKCGTKNITDIIK